VTSQSPDDEVDLLIDAWSRRLPDVDLTPLDVMSRLRRASIRLARLRSEAFATAELVNDAGVVGAADIARTHAAR